jgi:hypothetical protein
MKPIRNLFLLCCATALVFGMINTHAAGKAGRVMYAFGQVQAISGGGKGRQLRKGDGVFAGETIATRRGRVQVRFSDGGFASLQPDTQYRIDDYNYSGKADGNERSFLSLIRGSVRLVTGAIGKVNRRNFRLKTKLATIGIRGTMGEVAHCDADCGDMPVGTQMQGYGGTWDLVSGTFSGPVASGQAYLCDGSSCRQIQGGVAKREDVNGLGDEDEEEEEDSGYRQGQQVDRDGAICDLGGSCGDTVVLLNQVTAGAFQGSPGRSDVEDELAVVLFAGSPIGGIAFGDGGEEHDVSISTINFTALSAALNAFPDPEVVRFGNLLNGAVDANDIDMLNSNPASVAVEDFGPTSDNLLVKGRFTDGYILEIAAFLDTAQVLSSLVNLSNFQSEHFIFGQDPGVIPTGGTADYAFTGGTYSTATDGSSIGLGVTSGQIQWDFGLGNGSLNMTVEHGPSIFNVNGNLQSTQPKFFTENMVTATSGGGSYPVTLDGFFSTANADDAPLAAGLGYVIDMSSMQPYDIIGTAGFGLTNSNTTTTTSTTGTPVALPSGAYFAWAHAFIDTGSGTNSNGADSIVNGTTVVASAIDSNVDSFTATTADFVCTQMCSFSSGTATVVEEGSMPSIGASWVRWSANHNFSHPQRMSDIGDAHLIKLDAPATPIPVSGLGNYTVFGGGTTPTMNSGTGGGTLETAVGSTHSLTVDFGTGALTAAHILPFASTTVNVFGAMGPGPIGVQNKINYSGDLIGGTGACTGCVFGHDHFTFGGPNQKYVVGSGQFNTSGAPTSDEFAGGFTFILGDPAR